MQGKSHATISHATVLLMLFATSTIFLTTSSVVLPEFLRAPSSQAGFCCSYPRTANSCSTCTSKAATAFCMSGKGKCEKNCSGKWCPATAPKSGGTTPSVIASDSEDEDDDKNDDDESDGENPIQRKELYINPSFTRNIENSIRTATQGIEKKNLEIMSKAASAYWLDVKKKVDPNNDATTDTAAGILKDASQKSKPPLVTFIVYDLPNRDCHAKASNGEICCGATLPAGNCNYLDEASKGTCDNGVKTYKTEYIDKLAISVKKYCKEVPMVFVIEPDSLPNLVTNADDLKCGSKATETVYRQGITYAVKTLAKACPKATIYLDGAHGGWLGWKNNLNKFAKEVKGLGISKYLRGFSLNVANYQPLGKICPEIGFCVPNKNQDDGCCKDPCKLSGQYNPGHSELNYAVALADAMSKAISGFKPKMIIDTGRNGKSPRSNCANWCNARDAGCGLLPTTKTAKPDLVDAYLWLKTPGESDGCTKILPDGKSCPRFDSSCASDDSIGSKSGEPRAPEAGGWFDYQVKMLARNAVFQSTS